MDDAAWPADAGSRWRRADQAAAAPASCKHEAANLSQRNAAPASRGPQAGETLPLRYVPQRTDTATALAIEPYAVLVHKAKARAARISSLTLAGFAARGLRLRLPINLSPDNGDTGWIHPLFAEYTGWPGRAATELPELFLDLAALDGMKRLRDSLLGSCELELVSSSSQALHADLLDPARHERVAAWGNPLQLSAQLVRQGRVGPEFEMISLQRFMGLSSPSLFRAAPWHLAPDQHQAVPVEAALMSELPQDLGFYARLPHLGFMADTSLMSCLALDLLRPAGPDFESGASGADAAGRVYLAAASAHYKMTRHAHRQRCAAPVSNPSPTTLNPVW